MTFNKAFLFISCALSLACSQQKMSSTSSSINTGVSATCPVGNNVMSVTVDGSLCASGSEYFNEPCASVTLCALGSTTNCQTISNILVDTGSYGLRIFSSAINAPVKAGFTQTSSGNIAECALFGSGKTWGSVLQADVYLAGEPSSTVPIQLIDNTYSGGDSQGSPSLCSGSETGPSAVGYNGILGVGLFDEDCGTNCANPLPPLTYFTCTGAACNGVNANHGSQVPIANQVSNPVAHFSSGTDTNGVEMMLATVTGTGNLYNNGCLIFGVGTETNNIPPGGTLTYAANGNGEITVILSGTSYPASFIDSGSNAYYLDPSIPITTCGTSSFYCPVGLVTKTGTMNATNISIPILSALNLFEGGNFVFVDIGGEFATGTIDLGLPFFFGRNIWVGINGHTTTALGGQTGPYWAY